MRGRRPTPASQARSITADGFCQELKEREEAKRKEEKEKQRKRDEREERKRLRLAEREKKTSSGGKKGGTEAASKTEGVAYTIPTLDRSFGRYFIPTRFLLWN